MVLHVLLWKQMMQKSRQVRNDLFPVMKLLYKSQIRYIFHAHVKIKIPDFYEDSLFDHFFNIMKETDFYYNSYRENSYINRINRNAGSFVEVNEETVSILRKVILLSSFFDGKYDITIMPLIRLWGFYENKNPRLPHPKEIKKIKPLINYRNIEINGNEVRIAPGQEIITGSFIKAHAVDKVIRCMKEIGITDALINAGGSTIACLNNKAHPHWKVNVRLPESNRLYRTLYLRNQCLSTSAQSSICLHINGRKYGHILNPLTGYPSTNKQLGVITDNCMTGDIISTGLFNNTIEEFNKTTDELAKHYSIGGYLMDEFNRLTTKNLPAL